MKGRQYPVKITISDANELYIDQGKFDGDAERATKFMQDFCDAHKVTMESYGHGYGDLFIDGTCHEITPYGIDMAMMIKFCGGNVQDFAKAATGKASDLQQFSKYGRGNSGKTDEKTLMQNLIESKEIKFNI